MSRFFRRKRGTPTIGVQVDIAPEVKALIDQYIEAADVPQWAIIEAAIRAGKPDETGVPVGWEFPDVPADDSSVAHIEAATFPGLEHGGESLRRTG